MVKKKPFIDKKNASVYHLVRRSNRDVGGFYDEETGEVLDVPRDFVLMPDYNTQQKIDQRKAQAGMQKEASVLGNAPMSADDAIKNAKAQLKAANLIDDYDYDRHMMPITGTGVFYSKEGHQNDPSNDVRSKNVPIPMEPVIKEMDRQLDSIAITTDCMDDDIAQALFDYEEGEFEEILDDFCISAAQEPDIDGDEPDAFDFDAHIERLIEKAKMEENGGQKVTPENHEAWKKSAMEFEGFKPFKKYEDDAEDGIDYCGDDVHDDVDEFDFQSKIDMNPGVVAKLKPDEEKALCDKFEQTLLEYDSDEVGDLDEKCFEICGDKPLEGDIQIEAALDQFIQEKKDDILVAGSRHLQKRHGGGSKVFVNNNLVPFNAIDRQEKEEESVDETRLVEEVLAEADGFLANPEMDLPPEEVFIDGKSYFTMKEQNPWDCESILSTYSNVDNNPAVIGRKSCRRQKKKNRSTIKGIDTYDDSTIPEEQPVQILLSDKTGLPLGVLPERNNNHNDDYGEETFVSVNRGEARKKNETKEEKKARKKALKEERQISRIQKKMMREVFEEEFSRRSGPVLGNDVAGKSVFKYS